MELPEWFDYQLRSTLDGFIWAVHQVPKERCYAPPPAALGEWSAAQHVFHMLDYEENFAMPSMSQWLGVPPVIREEFERGKEQSLPLMEKMLSQFEHVRELEIGMLPKFELSAWNAIEKTTFWGDISLEWLVRKTYQHTLEHSHNILGLSLFWDSALKRGAH